MARNVVDVGLLYQIISGFDPKDEFSDDHPLGEIGLRKSLKGTRVGVPTNFFFDSLQPEVEMLVRKAIGVMEELGAIVFPVEIPGMAELTDASAASLTAEAYFLHKDHLADCPNDLGADVKMRIEKGREITGADYVREQLTRARVRREMQELLSQVDVLVTPTTPLTAFPFEANQAGSKAVDLRASSTLLLRGFNATGHPALSVCCGFTSEGLPAGLQIVSRLWDEATALHVGYAYEQATDWHPSAIGAARQSDLFLRNQLGVG